MRKPWTRWASVTVLAASILVAPASAAAADPYQNAALPVADRVADLMARMSLDEKIGQMTQAERGSGSPADVTAYRRASVLAGGASAPSPSPPARGAD